MIGDFIQLYKGSLVQLERVELISYFQLPTFDEFVRLERLEHLDEGRGSTFSTSRSSRTSRWQRRLEQQLRP